MSAGAKTRNRGSVVATLVWAGLAAAALLLPASNLVGWMPAVPWMRLALVFAGWGLDKLVHAVLFGVLTALAARAAGGLELRRPALTAFCVTVFYAVVLEAAQIWVPGRTADWQDFVADLVGIALGLIVAQRILRRG